MILASGVSLACQSSVLRNARRTPPRIDASIIWWALIIGLLVQAAIVYGCIRLALMHHHVWVQMQSAKADQAAKQAAKRATMKPGELWQNASGSRKGGGPSAFLDPHTDAL